jgi:hypothetical protein
MLRVFWTSKVHWTLEVQNKDLVNINEMPDRGPE